MAQYRVGIIGGGRKGSQHARAFNLNPRTEVVAVADTDPENRALFSQRFGVPGYADYGEMLAREAIDIAAPILPVRYNPEVVLGCARAGVRAILCEKPLAVSLEEADRMVAACRERRIPFAAGDLDANLPTYARAWEVIKSGALGPVRSIRFRGGSGAEISGGGCQILTLMRLFAGLEEVDWVIGWMAGDPFSDHDQGAAGYVRFANGVEGFIHREPDGLGRGLEVACERGVFRTGNFHAEILQAGDNAQIPAWENLHRMDGVLPEGNIYGRRSAEYDESGWRWPGDRNVATVQALVEALQTGVEPVGSGDNGRRVLELAIALRESHRRGHAAVTLPLCDRSLRLIPHTGRLENKKEVYGRDWYMPQVLAQRKGEE
ncbi:MAG: Gfo/Idh/MocA family oxidoreductase [Candidatus Latescibacterota bacterium]